MAVKTDIELAAAATIIQNETTNGANTADRVGQLLNDIIENKINTADAPVLPKVFKAYLSQFGTADPIATVIKSSLSGTPVLTRASTGVYQITLSGAFPSGKVFINSSTRLITDYSSSSVTIMQIYRLNDNIIQILTWRGALGSGVLTDTQLGDTDISIEVYP